jgi:hypothetical protein
LTRISAVGNAYPQLKEELERVPAGRLVGSDRLPLDPAIPFLNQQAFCFFLFHDTPHALLSEAPAEFEQKITKQFFVIMKVGGKSRARKATCAKQKDRPKAIFLQR